MNNSWLLSWVAMQYTSNSKPSLRFSSIMLCCFVGSTSKMEGYETAAVEPPETQNFDETYLANLRINNSIREVFSNRFVHMFSSYDHFLSQPHEVSFPATHPIKKGMMMMMMMVLQSHKYLLVPFLYYLEHINNAYFRVCIYPYFCTTCLKLS